MCTRRRVASDPRTWRSLSHRQQARLRADEEFAFLSDPPRGRVIEVRSADGTRIHTEVFGPEHGYPIVLSHGICCAIRFWSYQIAELSRDFRVIAFDHRGHGRSGRPPAGGYTFERLGDDLDAVLRHTVRPGERAAIAGHSMGGIAIQSWASSFPDNVGRYADAVALINTAPGELLPHLPLPGSVRAQVLDRITRVAMSALGSLPVPPRLPLRAQLLDPVTVGRQASPAVRAAVREMILTTPTATHGGFLRGLSGLRSSDHDLADLMVPTVVVGSESDRLLPFAQSRRIESGLPAALGLITLTGGHCGPLEQPGRVTGVLRDLASGKAQISSTA
ncbi:alpha/beta fold hydrolase [Nocardia tengchongensis]|uniref:alpha/beta fold hydrolase n=1 Tax=Nocardia tengchongensis TaxID=2055889 RepID=UPI0036A83A44